MSDRPSPGCSDELPSHAAFLRALARGLLFDRSAADDVAQRAMLLALQRRRRDRGGEFSLRSWLAGVVRNLARERGRAEMRRAQREQAAATPEALPSAADVVARLELTQRVVAAVKALEEPYRTTLLFRYFDGLKPAAIAKRMDVPVETVRTRIKRGLARLRGELDVRHGGDRAAWGALLLPAALTPASSLLGGGTASVALHALAVGGIGAIAMSTKVKAVIGVAAAVVATVLIVQKIDPPPSFADVAAARGAGSTGSAVAREAAPLSEPPDGVETPADGAGPAQAQRVAETMAPLVDPSLTFVIHGTTQLPSGARKGGLDVKLSCFDGYEAKGEPAATIELESADDGALAWAMRPPAGTVTILAESSEPGYRRVREELLVMSGDEPGQLTLTFDPFDAEIHGRVVDERDEPIPGARVTGWTVDGIAECDESGRYRLRASSSRSSTMLAAWAPGQAEARATATLSGPGASVELDFRLRPALVVRGRVTDVHGAPIAGARVRSSSCWYGETESDRDGRYRLDSADPTQPQDWIWVRCEGFATAGAVVQPTGGVVERDFVLERGVRVEGAVVDTSGNPVRGAEVWAGEGRHYADVRKTRSRDDGSFRLEHIGSGERKIGCEKSGFPPLETALLLPAEREVVAGIVLAFGESHFLAGEVVDRDGEPVSGAFVMYCSNPAMYDGHATTDAEGRFRIESMGAGPYTIRVARGGFLMHEEPSGPLDRDDARFVLERGGALAGRVIDAATKEPVQRFRIRFVESDPAPGERSASGVEASWVDPGRSFVTTDGVWKCEGEGVEVGSIAAIEVTATGYAPSIVRRVVVGASTDPDALVIELGPGARVVGSVLDEEGRPVAGALVRLETARDRANSWGARSDDARWCVRSGAHGDFAIEAAPAGEWRLAVEHAGFAPCMDGPFDVPASGSTSPRAIRLERGGVIEGVVLDASGNAEAGREVFLFVASPASTHGIPLQTVTGEDGSFRFDGLPRGRHQVSTQLRLGNQSANELTARVAIDGPEPVSVRLQPTGSARLRGRVTSDEPSLGPSSIHVQWLGPLDRSDGTGDADAAPPPNGLQFDRGAVARDGEFTIDAIEPGRYFVSASCWMEQHATYWSATAEIVVPESGTAELTLHLTRSR